MALCFPLSWLLWGQQGLHQFPLMGFRSAPDFFLAFHSGGEQLFGYLESGKEPRGISFFSLTMENRHFLYLLCLGAAERCWNRPWKGKVLQKEERMGPSFLERVASGSSGRHWTPPIRSWGWLQMTSGWNTTKEWRFTWIFKVLGRASAPGLVW